MSILFYSSNVITGGITPCDNSLLPLLLVRYDYPLTITATAALNLKLCSSRWSTVLGKNGTKMVFLDYLSISLECMMAHFVALKPAFQCTCYHFVSAALLGTTLF